VQLIACEDLYQKLPIMCQVRVCTDPGKVENILEIFKALKSLENDHSYGKVWKNP